MAIKKVTINLPEEEVKFLQEIADKENRTFTEVLRRSINTEKFFVEQEKAGKKILIEDGKEIRQIVRSK